MRTLALLTSLCVVASAVAAPIAGIEFTDFRASGSVTAITSDRLGEILYYTDQNFARLGAIDVATGENRTWDILPAGAKNILPAGSPQGIAVASNDTVWFPATLDYDTANARSVVGRFDPGTQDLQYFDAGIPGAFSGGIAHIISANDEVLVTAPLSSKILRFSRNGTRREIDVAGPNGARADSMKGIAFAKGKIWVSSGFRNVFEVPLTGELSILHRFEGGGFRAPRGIAEGADGMYVTLSGSSADLGNRIGRIAFDGVKTEWPVPTPDSVPFAIAAGGSNFFFTQQGARQIAEFNPLSGVMRESPVPNGYTPLSIIPLPYGPNGDQRLVINSLAPNLRDAVATLVKIPAPAIPPGPDPAASVSLGEGTDSLGFFESFRAGDLMIVLLTVTNRAEKEPTAGEIKMQFKLPSFVSTPKSTAFLRGEGECKTAGGIVTCTSETVIQAKDSIEVAVTFDAPRPPDGTEKLVFLIYHSVKGGGDVNEANNIDAENVSFVVHRGERLIRVPSDTLKPLDGRR